MASVIFQINGLCYDFGCGYAYKTVDIVNKTEVYKVEGSCFKDFLGKEFQIDTPCIVGFSTDTQKDIIHFNNCFSSNILQIKPNSSQVIYIIVINSGNSSQREIDAVSLSLNSFVGKMMKVDYESILMESIEKQLLFLGFDSNRYNYGKTSFPEQINEKGCVYKAEKKDNKESENSSDFSAGMLSKKIVPLISELLDVKFIPAGKSRKVFCDPSYSFGMIVSSSKHYSDISRDYWFAIKPEELDKIESCDRQYLAFGCQHSPNALIILIPMSVVKEKIKTMRSTLTPEGKVDHWHVDFKSNKDGELFWCFPKGEKLSLTSFIIQE